MRIALAGSGTLATSLLNALLDSSHEIVAVIQNGRTKRRMIFNRLANFNFIFASYTDVREIAKKNRIPLVYVDSMEERELQPLAARKPDMILVGGFGIIFKKALLQLPPLGCVNCHASLLPKHRGPNPYRAAILCGETQTGVTFHMMTERIDAGDLLEQYPFAITSEDTAASLLEKASALAADHVAGLCDRIEKGQVRPIPQDEKLATYDKNLNEEELFVRWEGSAYDLERKVRACYPFSPVRFLWRGRKILLMKCRAEPTRSSRDPGTILTVKPNLKIRMGDGAIVVHHAASCSWPYLTWPMLWDRLQVGENLCQ
ncbi:MAG TPA: methionyl-tRNA formyltransferase [Candidatus Hydrogenedentes bacterium]|nr:methionyl-tRNA formyltransferase [Candidatus Hydrogenedentota bacterium]HOL75569.1 methionyl-tRNA formyltransferase [Candidatus Hydrogenedentota bacterium]HPO87006.1 methionyl-tRNA formyltransferase [Candidatus Hydrogenedentota bacterium]